MKAFLGWILFIEPLNELFHLQEAIGDHSWFIFNVFVFAVLWTENL